MSANDILELLVDEDGNLDAPTAIETLNARVRELIDDGYRIDGSKALGIFADQLDFVSATLSALIVNVTASVVAAHRGIDQLITGRASEIPEYDVGEELAILLSEFELQHLGRTYDALEEVKAASDESA